MPEPQYNNARRICREVMIRIINAVTRPKDSKDLDRIPLEMRPSHNNTTRCCVYKDRAVIKYRCMASLGIAVEDETDELTTIKEYLGQNRHKKNNSRFLTVLDVACSSCPDTHYHITDACRGCAARSCMMVCPKDAVNMVNGQAKIDASKCINCGKCQKACSFNAVLRIPVPCEESCPVKAISSGPDGKKVIDDEKCIYCGKCINACPFGAIMECSQVVHVLTEIEKGTDITAMVAPAIEGQFNANWNQIAAAMRVLGFTAVMPVAEGADDTIAHEAQELAHKLNEGQEFMTTSCCPSYVQLVNKHIPDMKKFVSDTPSPLAFTARKAKADNPEAKTVFVGPCLAKRKEAEALDNVDYVITFEELGAMLVATEIFLDEMPNLPEADSKPSDAARKFAVSTGVSSAVAGSYTGDVPLKPVCVDGLDKKSIALLKTYAKGKAPGNFIEVMSCCDGCVGGPCVLQNAKISGAAIKKIGSE